MTSVGRVRIERFRAEYLVPAGHPSPARVQSQLDQAMSRDLPQMLEAVLEPWLGADDESLWLVRRLDLAVDVDVAWPRDRSARRWARQVAQELARALTDRSVGSGVIRFENRAAYLARFLADLAAGDAWGRWYYRSFEGLRRLPTSGALRTALCDEPAIGLAALLRLAGADRTRVIDALTTLDARRVLDGLAGRSAADDRERCWRAIGRAWEALPAATLPTDAESHASLELCLAACDTDPQLAGHQLRAAAGALVRLARLIEIATPDRRRAVLAAVRSGDPARLYEAAGAADAEMLRPLSGAPAGLIEAVVDVSTTGQDNDGPVRRESDGPAEPRRTVHGGMFLLLPMLDRLPFGALADGWPRLGMTPADAVLRLLVLAKCLGGKRTERVLRDTLVLDQLGFSPPTTILQLREWVGRVPSGAVAGLATTLARSLSDTVPPRKLCLLRARMRGAPAAALVDGRTGDWLWAGGYTAGRTDRLANRLVDFLESSGIEPAELLAAPDLVARIQAHDTELPVRSKVEAAESSQAEEPGLAHVLTNEDRLTSDLRYLTLPAALGVSRELDLALSVAAQRTLSQFAGRLPGFAASSPAYLNANFLDVPATLLEEPQRRVVRLGRAPLQLVLGMGGLARGEYRVSWSPERPFVLFPEGD
jgi:hypothetical protein